MQKKRKPIKNVRFLSPNRFFFPKEWNLEDFKIQYADFGLELIRQREKAQLNFAEEGGQQFTITHKFDGSGENVNLYQLAHYLDNAGILEGYSTLLPGFSAFRRMSLHLPKGKRFVELEGTNGLTPKAAFRQVQRTKDAYLALVICLLDEEADENLVKGWRSGLAIEGFGQIMANEPDADFLEEQAEAQKNNPANTIVRKLN